MPTGRHICSLEARWERLPLLRHSSQMQTAVNASSRTCACPSSWPCRPLLVAHDSKGCHCLTQTHDWLAVGEEVCGYSQKLAVSSEHCKSQTTLHLTCYSMGKYLFCTKLCITVTFTFHYCCDAVIQPESDGSLWQEERKIFHIKQKLKDGIFENGCYSFVQHQGSVEQNSQTLFAIINEDLDLLQTAGTGLQPPFQNTSFSKLPGFPCLCSSSKLGSCWHCDITDMVTATSVENMHCIHVILLAVGLVTFSHRNLRYILKSKFPSSKINLVSAL